MGEIQSFTESDSKHNKGTVLSGINGNKIKI